MEGEKPPATDASRGRPAKKDAAAGARRDHRHRQSGSGTIRIPGRRQLREPGRHRVQISVTLGRKRGARMRSVGELVAKLMDSERRDRQEHEPAACKDTAHAIGGHTESLAPHLASPTGHRVVRERRSPPPQLRLSPQVRQALPRRSGAIEATMRRPFSEKTTSIMSFLRYVPAIPRPAAEPAPETDVPLARERLCKEQGGSDQLVVEFPQSRGSRSRRPRTVASH